MYKYAYNKKNEIRIYGIENTWHSSPKPSFNISLFMWFHMLWFSLYVYTLQWRYNEGDGYSNHRRLDCLLNRLFRRRSKKAPKLCVTSFMRGIHRCPADPPHVHPHPPPTPTNYKGPVTRKMFPFDDGIMKIKHSDTMYTFWGTYRISSELHLCCTDPPFDNIVNH